jgi:hypothetical protein
MSAWMSTSRLSQVVAKVLKKYLPLFSEQKWRLSPEVSYETLVTDPEGHNLKFHHRENFKHFLKSTIFWDIKPCSPLSTDVSEEHIASIFRVEKISWARNQREIRWQAIPQIAYFFDPADRGDMFLRNVGWHSTHYTTLYLRSWYSSKPPLREPQILYCISFRNLCLVEGGEHIYSRISFR